MTIVSFAHKTNSKALWNVEILPFRRDLQAQMANRDANLGRDDCELVGKTGQGASKSHVELFESSLVTPSLILSRGPAKRKGTAFCRNRRIFSILCLYWNFYRAAMIFLSFAFLNIGGYFYVYLGYG